MRAFLLVLLLPAALAMAETPEEKEARVLGLVEEEDAALATPPEPKGRPDPFGVDRNGTGTVRKLAKIRVSELALKGIVVSGKDRYALMLGPDDVTHSVRAGEKLLDGRVKRIDIDRIVFVEMVAPPEGGEPVEREVVKKLVPNG